MTAPSPGAALGGWDPVIPPNAGPEWASASPAQRADAISAAVHTVWALSGRQYGVARVLLAPHVPCGPLRRQRTAYGAVSAILGPLSGPRRLSPSRRIALPGPVVSVEQVTIEGAAIPPEDWALQLDGHLVRRDGGWPSQDLDWPTFLVDYTRGVPVPLAGQLAAGVLAVELMRARVGSKACTLPSRTREVARAGVTISVAGPEELSSAGLTGNTQVDPFLVASNPTKRATPASVWSVELGYHRILETGPAA